MGIQPVSVAAAVLSGAGLPDSLLSMLATAVKASTASEVPILLRLCAFQLAALVDGQSHARSEPTLGFLFSLFSDNLERLTTAPDTGRVSPNLLIGTTEVLGGVMRRAIFDGEWQQKAGLRSCAALVSAAAEPLLSLCRLDERVRHDLVAPLLVELLQSLQDSPAQRASLSHFLLLLSPLFNAPFALETCKVLLEVLPQATSGLTEPASIALLTASLRWTRDSTLPRCLACLGSPLGIR